MKMTKQEAVEVFGGTQAAMARAMGKQPPWASKLPAELPQGLSDAAVGAALRMGLKDRLPARFFDKTIEDTAGAP